MSIKFGKRILSFAAAVALSCASMTVQAAEIEGDGYVYTGYVDDTADWDINDYADNIKEIYKMDYPKQADAIDEIVGSFLADSEFVDIFERAGGSAFLIVEESLRDVLDPDITPFINDGNLYYTKYNIPLIVQKSGYSDGAAAAVLMALYGCGTYTYPNSDAYNTARQNALINEISWDSNNRTTVGEITRTMRRYFSGSNGFDFQTKYYSDYLKAINAIANSLSMNTAPVVRIPDGSSYYYGVVTQLEYNEETIRIIDPRTGTIRNITFDDFKTMINQNNKIIWMSVYAPDKSGEAIEQVKSEYLPEKSYFTKSGVACTDHADFENPSLITCKWYDRGWQCAGFAQYVFDMVKGRKFSSSLNEASVTGFGILNKSLDLDKDAAHTGILLEDGATAQKYLQGLSIGAYVRVKTGFKDKNGKYRV